MHAGFQDRLRSADASRIDDRFHQTVHRIAPEILGHRQDLPGTLRGRDHLIATANGQRQWFLDHRVPTGIEQRGCHDMVRTGIGRAIGGFQSIGARGHRLDAREHQRPISQELVRFIRQIIRIGFVQIADGHQLDHVPNAAFQLGQSGEMPPAHPPTADDRETQRFHPTPPRRRASTPEMRFRCGCRWWSIDRLPRPAPAQ